MTSANYLDPISLHMSDPIVLEFDEQGYITLPALNSSPGETYYGWYMAENSEVNIGALISTDPQYEPGAKLFANDIYNGILVAFYVDRDA